MKENPEKDENLKEKGIREMNVFSSSLRGKKTADVSN